MTAPAKSRSRRSREFPDRLLGITAIFTIALAYIFGLTRARADIMPFLKQALPTAERFEVFSNNTFTAYVSDQIIGYVSLGTAMGYGGPLEIAVAVDLQGSLIGFAVIDQKETPSFYRRVQRSELFESMMGKSYQDRFQIGADLDGISGATYTSRAIAEAVRQGSRQVAAGPLNLAVTPDPPPKIIFGLPEIVLVALFMTGFIAHSQKFKFTKQARWLTMIVGLLVLGFWLNRPLTIASINQLLLGFWPVWQTNLYWYILIGGILFVFTADNKNPYCEWFCPFGAAQECMGAIGGAKVKSPGQFRDLLKWIQRGLAWLAIVLALIFRNPGLSSYEIFGTLFDLTGSTKMFALLGIVLLFSLFIKRPWCTYLCPLHPVDEFIRMIRRWILESWKKIVSKNKA